MWQWGLNEKRILVKKIEMADFGGQMKIMRTVTEKVLLMCEIKDITLIEDKIFIENKHL